VSPVQLTDGREGRGQEPKNMTTRKLSPLSSINYSLACPLVLLGEKFDICQHAFCKFGTVLKDAFLKICTKESIIYK
jgi:hypothetical protein